MTNSPEPDITRAKLQEYSDAQQQVGTIESGIWQGFALIVGASVAAIAILLSQHESDHSAERAIAIESSIFAAVGALVVFVWWRFWTRYTTASRAIQLHMRTLESDLNLRRNIFMYLLAHWPDRFELDEWKHLNDEDRDKLDAMHRAHRLRPPDGNFTFAFTTCMVILGFLGLAAAKWLEFLL